MFDRIKTRLNSEQGFTLIELLVVIIILGILVAIAVPSYLSFRGNAEASAAKSNVRSAIPAAEQIFQQSGDYTTVTGAGLRTAAPGVASTVKAAPNAAKDGYCIQDTEGSSTYFYSGGNGGTATITSGVCPVATYTVS